MAEERSGPVEISSLDSPPGQPPTSNPPPYQEPNHQSPREESTEQTPLLAALRQAGTEPGASSLRSSPSTRRTNLDKRRVPPRRPQLLPLQLLFFLISTLFYVSISLLIMSGLTTLHPQIAALMPSHHGSTFLPMWYAFLSALSIGLALAAYAFPTATPSASSGLSWTLAALALVDLVALVVNPDLRAKEALLSTIAALLLLVCSVVAATTYTAVGHYLPALDAYTKASREYAQRERDARAAALAAEQTSGNVPYRALPIHITHPPTPPSGSGDADDDGSEAKPPLWIRCKRAFTYAIHFSAFTLPLLALHIAALVAVVLLTADLILRAYDSSHAPPSPGRLWEVSPGDGAGSYRVLLACGPFGGEHRYGSAGGGNETLLPRRTILMFSPAGVPGLPGAGWATNLSSVPFPNDRAGGLDPGAPGGQAAPLNRAAGDDEWRSKHYHHRLCYFDRPGYGFSDNAPTARLAHSASALDLALSLSGEVDRLTGRGGGAGRDQGGFVLVGQGFGGLVARVFAGLRPELVRGVLYVDAETEMTYFNPAEQTLRKTLRYLFSDYASALVSPLGIRRYLALAFGSRRPPRGHAPRGRLARLLSPAREGLNPSLARAALQEAHLAHSRSSASRRDLEAARGAYPARAPAVVLSGAGRLGKESRSMERWTQGQEYLARVVTDKEALVRWEKVSYQGGGELCESEEGGAACGRALKELLAR